MISIHVTPSPSGAACRTKRLLFLNLRLVAVVFFLCAVAPAGTGSVVINEIHCNPDDETERVEFVELHNGGADDVDLSGWYFDKGISYAFPQRTTLPAGGYLIVTESPEAVRAKWSVGRFSLPSDRVLGPYEGRLSNEGENLVLCNASGEIEDEVDYRIGFPWPTVGDAVPTNSSGTAYSMQLVHPDLDNGIAGNWRSASPTPTGMNHAVYSKNVGPYMDEVRHEPGQPLSGQPVTVTIRVTDPDGVIGVSLEYQVVAPGKYIPAFLPTSQAVLDDNPDAPPAPNPRYHNSADWIQVFLRDDGADGDAVAGDHVYTATLPGQPNRTLVRYRIETMDLLGKGTMAPRADDAALNFAYFVYDGVPDYEGFSFEMLQSLPVHLLLTRSEDMRQASDEEIPQFAAAGSNPARFVYNWRGTFVYDGVVYDNIRYRLRGANGRYLGGSTKRSMRFRFNRGHYFQALDADGEPYPAKWRTLTTAKGFDNRLTLTYSLNEHINFHLFNKLGVPAPYSYYFHFRVVDGAEEAPDPWRGDFWGLGFAQESYDSDFLDAHGLEKGNLYKLINSTTDAKAQQRYQAPGAVMDGSDHDNIQRNLTAYSTAEFIRNHVRLDEWYVYHALCQAIRHYDYWPTANKNAAWYFEPVYTPPNSFLGLMWTLPWDTDATWGPTWNDGYDVVYNSVFGAGGARAELQTDYFNAVREIRDLLWQRDQIEPLIDEFAAPIAEFVEADRRRWLNAPSDAGNYNGLGGAGKNGIAALVRDMKNFAFVGGSWPGGSVGAGGRAAFLDSLADGAEGDSIPRTPTVTYVGEPGFPANALRFQTSAFSDPQGAYTFAAMKWRIAEVSPDTQGPAQPDSLTLVPDRASWRYLKGLTEPSATTGAWRQAGFDDSMWQTGPTPIGYGEAFIATTLGDMQGLYTTVYARKQFTVSDPAAFDNVLIDVQYDDGILVWINGRLVVRENVASAEPLHGATAESAIEISDFVSYLLADPTAYLVEGTNTIAVQLFNASLAGSSDCFFDLRLLGHLGSQESLQGGGVVETAARKYEIEAVWESAESMTFNPEVTIPAGAVRAGRTYRVRCRMKDNTGRWSHWSDPVQFEAGESLSVDSGTGLRITELMYNPPVLVSEPDIDNEDFEFIELKNIGDEVLDLSDVSFVEGIAFDFRDGDITMLPPGEFVLIVRNREAFLSYYGSEMAALIAGQYEGKLANEGESIRLVDFWNGAIAEFAYDDADGWPDLADGAGHSLVPLPSAIPGQPVGANDYSSLLRDPANWRASTYIGGSPGMDDPL